MKIEELVESKLEEIVDVVGKIEAKLDLPMNPFTMATTLGMLEGLASSGRVVTIERKDDLTSVKITHPSGDEVHIEKPSLMEVLVEIFEREDME